jgi:regulator of protease activity HflC (stomatin/prohibitin superfamily)
LTRPGGLYQSDITLIAPAPPVEGVPVSQPVTPYRREGFEKPYLTMNGIAMLLLVIGLIVLEVLAIVAVRNPVIIVANAFAIVFLTVGFFMLQPNEAAVLTLFGAYLGTERAPGLRWTWPWNMRKRVSVRVRNHAVDTLKVNDKRGNPIDIGAVVVWRVEDTAQALFDVDDFEQFVHVQSESAVRHVASRYNYDEYEDHEAHELTLRGGADAVAEALRVELHTRVQLAGVAVEEAKITHLAYAPEIAGAMLRRQQAEAVIAARTKIVHGAVSMVEMALKELSEKGVVDLDDERRAAMVSNLMVVLCSERDTQPIVNTGTLYT